MFIRNSAYGLRNGGPGHAASSNAPSTPTRSLKLYQKVGGAQLLSNWANTAVFLLLFEGMGCHAYQTGSTTWKPGNDLVPRVLLPYPASPGAALERPTGSLSPDHGTSLLSDVEWRSQLNRACDIWSGIHAVPVIRRRRLHCNCNTKRFCPVQEACPVVNAATCRNM
jgi:hypothetical protein